MRFYIKKDEKFYRVRVEVWDVDGHEGLTVSHKNINGTNLSHVEREDLFTVEKIRKYKKEKRSKKPKKDWINIIFVYSLLGIHFFIGGLVYALLRSWTAISSEAQSIIFLIWCAISNTFFISTLALVERIDRAFKELKDKLSK